MAEQEHPRSGGPRWTTLLLVVAAVAGLGAAMLTLPAEAPGLSALVESRMPEAAMANRVTVVLMDFRAYDTLLEIGVLLLAVTAIWSLAERPLGGAHEVQSLLSGFVRMVAPTMVVIAGYLFWAGSDRPGGEFQSGAVLGALGILLLLAGRRPSSNLLGRPLRLALSAGLLVFLSVGLAVMLLGGNFLEYPRSQAKALIILSEVAATLSICAVLVSLYVGGRPYRHGEGGS